MITRRPAIVLWLALIALDAALPGTTETAAQESPTGSNVPPHTSSQRSNPPSIAHDLEEAVRSGQLADEEGEHLFGSLTGPESGIHVEPVYWGEVFSNTRGGIATHDAAQYEGLLDLALIADLKQLGMPFAGEFFILGQTTHGRGLTEDYVGDALVLSNIDSFDNRTQVSEYWWELHLLDDDVRVRLGKQDLNTEFLVVDLAGDFVQSGFGISPHLAVPTYPDASAAVLLMVDLTDNLQAKAGVWDGAPDGRTWGFSGTGITLTAAEIEYRYELAGGRLPGTIDGGALYLAAGEVLPGPYLPQSWGIYLDFEQLLWRENPDDEEDEQGFGGFLQYSDAAPDEEVGFPQYFGAGFVYRGLLPGRDDDGFGAGLAATQLNSGGTNRETVVECYYKAAIRPGMVVQPDLQYIASPSGVHRDALVVGLRFVLTL